MKRNKKTVIYSLLAIILTLTSMFGTNRLSRQEIKANIVSADTALANTASADTAKASASITGEFTAKRTKFVKQFSMSDGSYTAVTYSMPVHYKKAGKWKEIDTTLVKSGSRDLKKTVQVLQITKPKPPTFPSKYPKKQTKNPSSP